jgi:uncharacterized protein (DUF433 family)
MACYPVTSSFSRAWWESQRFERREEAKTMKHMLLERIDTNPQIMSGKPIIKGASIPVETILKKLADNVSAEPILREYPRLTEDDVKAAAYYAAKVLETTPH